RHDGEGHRDGMIFKRCLPRLLLGCAIALALSAPGLAANPADTTTPAAATAAADKNKAAKAKPATTKTGKSKPVAKPGAKTANGTPLPRARPAVVASVVPMVPVKATLSPTQILPTTSF